VREVPEGGTLDIAAPAGQTLVITKAVYGPADGSTPANPGDITEDPSAVLDALPRLQDRACAQVQRPKNGSWICMVKDAKRTPAARRPARPADHPGDAPGWQERQEEILHIRSPRPWAMLFIDNVLYLNGHGAKGLRPVPLQGHQGRRELRRRRVPPRVAGGSGEHGAPRADARTGQEALLGVRQFHRRAQGHLAPSSPHRNYATITRSSASRTANGFGAGKQPPGGYLARNGSRRQGRRALLRPASATPTCIAFNGRR